MCENYETMRAEINRLHKVARFKDSVLKDCINTCKVLLKIAEPKIKDKNLISYYEDSIKDFENNLG